MPAFFWLCLWDFVADSLPEVHRAKPIDQDWSQRERKSERRQSRHHGSERFVAQNAETHVVGVQRI